MGIERRTRRAALRGALVLGFGALATGVLAAVGLFVLAQGAAAPEADGTQDIRGLVGRVAIARDVFGVPHVRAETLADAFAGLGFAHAQDRLWQMEVLRRHASGRLSEFFGPRTLALDRLARTLGHRHGAKRELDRLEPVTRRQLEGYVAGINGWVRRLRSGVGPLPFEVRWLGIEIEDWSVVDVLSILRLRAWTLSQSLNSGLLLDRLTRQFGGRVSQDFFPVRPIDRHPRLLSGLLEISRVASRSASSLGLQGPVGSLGFVIGGSRSASGRPILVNDPHLQFQLPAAFYLAHLHTPDFELAGATWAGLPIFWTGTNRSIAWGQVLLHASTSDIYVETLHPSDPLRYNRNGRWLDANRRVERIAVRYRADEVIDVVSTRHGPLLGSISPNDPSASAYSLRWVGQDERSGIEALLAVQRSENREAFRSALAHYVAPVATFLFAHRDGEIGLQVAGRLPVRQINTSLLPVPGYDRYYDWRGFAEFDDLPSEFGSELSSLVAATHPDPSEFQLSVNWLWNSGGAPDRVRELLAEPLVLDLDAVGAIQRDTKSTRAPRVLAILLRHTGELDGFAEQVRRRLMNWDGGTEIDSVDASMYHVFRQVLARRMLADRLGDDAETAALLAAGEPVPGALLGRFLERVNPAKSRELIRASLAETWAWLSVNVSANPKRWSWGEMQALRLRHSFERLGSGLERWFGARLGRGPFAVPGDPDSAWTMHHGALPRSNESVGPVLRYAVDLAEPEHARVSLAGGQSGHTGLHHYDDALADWLRGRARPLWMHRATTAYFEEGRWELRPAAR